MTHSFNRRQLLTGSAASLVAFSMLPRVQAQAPLTVGGSTAGQSLVAVWLKRFGANIVYQGVGSGRGIAMAGSGALDIGLSDVALTAGQLQAQQLVQVPLFADGIALVANLAGVASLRIPSSAVADMYSGGMQSWDQGALALANPGVKIPKLPVSALGRSDESGSTKTFSQFMGRASRTWAKEVGSDMTARWPRTVTPAKGSSGMLAAISTKSGAVGYLALADASRSGLLVPQLESAPGKFVSAGLPGVLAQLESCTWDTESGAADLGQSATAGAWPLTFVVYALVKVKSANSGAARSLLTSCIGPGRSDLAGGRVAFVGATGAARAEKALSRLV